MSDYCKGCEFDPKKSCPITSLYWAFLQRHRDQLEKNPRMRMPYASLRKRSEAKRQRDLRGFTYVREKLGPGERLSPRKIEQAVSQ